MKKLKFFITSLIILSVFFTGCNKDEDEIINLNPNAGVDFLDIENDGYVVTLAAQSAPEGQTGVWRIYAGDNGHFENVNDPKSKFFGEPGEFYQLGWELKQGSEYEADQISVSYLPMRPEITTRITDTIYNNVSLHLKSVAAKFGTVGSWEIIEGIGGRILNADSNNADFVGKPFSYYVVKWKLTYGSKEEFLEISFTTDELKAQAGEDNLDINLPRYDPEYYALDAILPAASTAVWNIIEGKEGLVNNIDNAKSLFQGDRDEVYTLTWKVTVDEYSSIDTLQLRFRGKWGMWEDPRDKQTYKFTEVNGLDWMSENYNYPEDPGAGSWYYGQSDRAVIQNGGYPLETVEDRKFYGRLYTWHTAIKATPEGWRLPSTQEINELVNSLGGPIYAGEKVKLGGKTGIDLNYAGYFDYISSQDPAFRNVFQLMDSYGLFWTDNYIADKDQALVEIVIKAGEFMNETPISATYNAASVRYVRDSKN